MPIYLFIYLRFCLFIHERHREREAETQAEGEVGSMQGAQCGIQSQTLGSRPGPKAEAQPLSHPGILIGMLNSRFYSYFTGIITNVLFIF